MHLKQEKGQKEKNFLIFVSMESVMIDFDLAGLFWLPIYFEFILTKFPGILLNCCFTSI